MGGRNYSFEYYENPFKNLLSLDANIVVFSHPSEINKISTFFEKNNFSNYKIVDYDLNNYTYSDQIYRMKEQKGIIDKDGLISGNSFILNDRNHHLCLSKIDFLNMAIESNYFNSDNYYWVDAGLFHNGLIPNSFGGMERFIKPNDETFWPINKNNICKPELIDKLMQKNGNTGLVFLGLKWSYGVPQWWNNITEINKPVHIVGGFFGGKKDELLKICSIFKTLTKQVIELNDITLEEDLLTIIVLKNNYFIEFGLVLFYFSKNYFLKNL